MVTGGMLMVALAGGPRDFLGRTWNFHVLLFGGLAVILGNSIILFDLVAKTFSMSAGFARPRQWLRGFTELFTLERWLALGLVVFLAGLGLEIKIVIDWVRSGYGELMAVRGITIGMVAMVVGGQIIFSSFLLSLLMIRRR